MIGALQQAISASAGGEPELSIFVTPSRGNYTSTNGSYTTPSFTVNVTGGTPPYTYLWESTDAEILSPESDKTRVRLTGYNEIKIYQVSCTVTDSELNTANSNAAGSIEFGTGEAIRP